MRATLKTLFLLSLLSVASSIVLKYSVETSSAYVLLSRFGFLQGGTITGRITQENTNVPSLHLLACNQQQYSNTFGFFSPDPCGVLNNSTCDLVLPFNPSVELDFTIPRRDMYYFILTNCELVPYKAEIDINLLNPNGQHLSFEHIPLPALYGVLTGVWLLAFVVWIGNWVKHRSQRSLLHRLITVFPFLYFLFSLVALLYWELRSQEGTSSLGLVLVYGFVRIAGQLAFYGILMSIASGWGVSRVKFGKDIYFVVGITFGLMLSLLMGFLLHGFFNLFTLIIYIVIIVSIFLFANRNIRQLESAVEPATDDSQNSPQGSNKDKVWLFRRFKIIITLYVCLVMFLLVADLFFLGNLAWVSILFQELLELALALGIGWTFRLRPRNVYYQLDGVDLPVDLDPVPPPYESSPSENVDAPPHKAEGDSSEDSD